MKLSSMLLGVILVSQNLFAIEPTVLLSTLTAGGMPGPQGSTSYKVSIMSDGNVVSETSKGRTMPLIERLAQLSDKALNNLKAQIAKINPNAKLSTPAPNTPRCMDAPFTRVDATQGDKTIEIFLRQDCITSTLEGGSQGRLVDIIEGFQALTR